jgi:multicomponent Na+:H+ antiporter subunit B
MLHPWRKLILSGALAALLMVGMVGLPEFSDPQATIHQHVVPRYLIDSTKEIDVPNIVTAVLASYRGYDTLGETTVVFTAGAGVIALLRRRRQQRLNHASSEANDAS